MKGLALVVPLVALAAACQTDGSAARNSSLAQRSEADSLTLERLFELGPKLKLPAASFGSWIGSGHEYYATEGDDSLVVAIDAASGHSRPLHDVGDEFSLSKDGGAALFKKDGDLFVHHAGSEISFRVTSDAAEEDCQQFSPDGEWVSFVRDSNLFVTSSQLARERQLTHDGDETHLFGKLDWVYQEEVYGRGDFQAHWWSPDSSRIAFLALDETEVPEYTIADTRERHPKLEVWRYPKAGDPNPKARLGVVDVKSEALVWFDLAQYPDDVLIVRVGWTPDSQRVVAQLQDRTQTWLDLVVGDPASGKVERLFGGGSPAWTMPSDGPYWLEGTNQFLWLSENNGHSHLYLYERDGKFVRALTSGPWEVDFVRHVDSKRRVAWISADREDVKGSQLFELSIDTGEMKQLTQGAGTHDISISPDGAFFVDTYSSHTSAPVRTLFDIEGKRVRELARVDESLFAGQGFAGPEFHKPKTRDGFEMEAALYKPASFDPSKRYPLLCFTYAGPHAPQVRDVFYNFNALFNQMIAQEGYLVWVCDNRSASGKGLISAASSYKKFGPGELADLEDGIDWLCDKGFVDESRIGIWGWSFGGYMTAYAMTHSKRFKMGIAGAPVTDWRLYDSIYTERYMGLPEENESGYEAGSVLSAAKDLHGRLLLICGEIDENVHAQNSLQLAAALQRGGKQFDFMMYPGNRHGITEPNQKKHLYTMMAEYVKRNL